MKENSKLEGPFQLANDVIDMVIQHKGPAVFLLRRIAETPEYAYYRGLVGRTDNDDLAQTLKQWLASDYRVFSFEYVESAAAAFALECKLWHILGGPIGKLDNEQHPRSDRDDTRPCPVCSTDVVHSKPS